MERWIGILESWFRTESLLPLAGLRASQVGLTDYSQVDALGSWYKFVNFWGGLMTSDSSTFEVGS